MATTRATTRPGVSSIGNARTPAAPSRATTAAEQLIVLGGDGQRPDALGVEAPVEDGDGRLRELGFVAGGATAGHDELAQVADLQARHGPGLAVARHDARALQQSR